MRVKIIISWIAAIPSMVVFATPVTQFINVLKGRLWYQDAPIFLVATIYCNCLIWYIYGDLIYCIPLKVCNFFGLCFSLLFSIIYLSYEIKKFFFDVFLNTVIIFTGTWAIFRTFTILLPDLGIVGKACTLTSLISLSYSLHLIYRAAKENNSRLISLHVAIFTILSGIFWVIFGFIEWDFYIVYPNLFTIFVAFAQIIVWINNKVKYTKIGQIAGSSDIKIEIESIGDNNSSKKTNSIGVNVDEESREEGDKMKVNQVKIVTRKEFQ